MRMFQIQRNSACGTGAFSSATSVTIAKFSALFIIFVITAAMAQTTKSRGNQGDFKVIQVGRISDPAITESSGVVVSSVGTNHFWTHNDGPYPVLFGINREGNTLSRFKVAGVSVTDWEDIARDAEGHLYLGDIGNNDARRQMLAVYRLAEPKPGELSGTVKSQVSWMLRFPGEPFDCESLFIWKTNGYVVSKVFKNANAAVYRFDLARANTTQVLERIAELPVSSPVTGADISPDGRRLGLVAKNGAYIFEIGGDVGRAGQAKPSFVKFREGQIEGCCFVPEGLLAVSEKREIFLFPETSFQSGHKSASQSRQ